MFQSSILILANVSSEGARLFIDLLAILATAAVVATLFKRLRLESIPGYLVAGALIGPYALGLVVDEGAIKQISNLAVILLMFTIGLMLESDALKRGMFSMLAVGVVSTVLVVLGCWPIVMALGLSAPQGLAASLAFSMSSTAVLLRLLQQRRELKQPHGQLCVGVSIAQDILSVVFLAALPLLAAWQLGPSGAGPGPGSTMNPVLLWALRLVAVACIIIAGRIVLPGVLHFVAGSAKGRGSTGSSELVLVASAGLAIGAALALGSLGFSPEMGAFLGGFMLSFTPYRHQLAGQLAPMKDLLMAVFFTAVGLRLDPGTLTENWAHILFGVAVVMVGKTVLIGASAWALGASGPVAILAGAYLANAGEFTLVIVASAAGAGVLDAQDVAPSIAIVVVSLVLSPVMVGPAHDVALKAARLPLAPWIRASAMRHPSPRPADPTSPADDSVNGGQKPAADHRHRHVIIAGFGPVGRNLADRLTKRGVPVTVIEMNPKTVEKQTTLGKSIIYGDVTNVEVLESAGILKADALVITVPDELATMRATQLARSLAPGIFIATRTNYLSQAIKARRFGADSVIVEEIVTAEAMANLVSELLDARKVPPPA